MSAARLTNLVVQARRPDQENDVELKFSDLKLFSHGVYSNVYTGMMQEMEGQENTTRREKMVAIKKCWGFEDDIKEVRILRRLNRHRAKNIITLLYIFSSKYGDKVCFSLVMAFMPTTLSAHIKKKKPIPIDILETKIFTWQMFRGMAWMHKNEIFHRDLKPQNILIDPDTFLLQIADFGSSVIIGEYDQMSSYHVTRYYRPIELLLGSHKYGPAIDVWSAGCVLAEMLRGRTFLAGSTTDNQLERILECFGPPTPAQLQAMYARRTKLLSTPAMVRAIETFKERGQNGLSQLMPLASEEALRLVEKICKYTPKERLCGPKLLANPFFDPIFDPQTEYNGKPLTLLTKADLAQAVAGDLPHGADLGTLESHTGGTAGSNEPAK